MRELSSEHWDGRKDNFMLANANVQETEIELWNAFRCGNRAALNVIFEMHVRMLYTYGKSMTRDQELISDCIQDVFVELWIRRDRITPQIKSIRYYLIKSVRRRILKRLAIDQRILGQRIPENYSDEVEYHIESNFIQDQNSSELSLQLVNSVGTLSKGQQEAIHLKFYENMTYEEIASVMNTNVKAVYNLIGKSIISLRKFFKAHPMEQK